MFENMDAVCGSSLVHVRAMDDDFAGISFLDNWGDDEETLGSMHSSSDVEDGDGEIILNPVGDVDLPTINEQFLSSDDALRVTSHRFAMMGKGRKKHRIKSGVFINMGLITFLTALLLFVDWCAWRIVRLPLAPFYLTRPFFISTVLVACAGYVCVPFLRRLKIHQIFRKEGPARHFL
ncbi:hypothetical protein L1049_009501 [Liquidambar formosana]|uniref:Transmembrane protein n=1 Tax=Liquidambar formosana TaxID=63359 RepID=A0AAP0N6T2_LIQFO